jgi:hypothetical protein
VVSDRYSGYAYIDLDQRQVCLAHPIRDFLGDGFEFIEDGSNESDLL